jgi:dUTP pyrophosphatase
MRKFEKISFNQFSKDNASDVSLYDEYLLPSRSTHFSAGYDFKAISEFTIKPGEIKKIPTGYKVTMNEDEALFIYVRSSMGFKYNVRMCNQVGIIESDYYNNESNEGHMWVALQNEGTKDYTVKKGESYAQGVFQKFFTIDEEEKVKIKRKGGLGSTTKE